MLARFTGRIGSSQEIDDRAVSVIKAAFQNLRNYDENPRGIRIPEDQNPEVLAETGKEKPGDDNETGQISAFRPTLNPIAGLVKSGF